MRQLVINKKVLEEVLNEKNGPCVTIQIPTNRIPTVWKHNRLKMQLAVEEAKMLLENMELPKNIREELSGKLYERFDRINFRNTLDGMGMYISPRDSVVINFPFNVQERIVVGRQFEVRNILRLKEYSQPYLLLLLNKKIIRLFSGEGNVLTEVKDENFPLRFQDEYEYARPVLGVSYGFMMKSFEKDKTVINKERFGSFIAEASNLLNHYIFEPDQKLVVAGTRTSINEFKKSSKYQDQIIAELPGDFAGNGTLLADRAWNSMRAYKDAVVVEQVQSLEEINEREHIVFGIHEVCKAANEGKGQLLLVENNFHNFEDDYRILGNDITDIIIDKVLSHNGQVMFSEDNALEKYHHIVLKLRY